VYIVNYHDEYSGPVSLAVASPKQLFSIANVLEKQKIKFHVFDSPLHITPKDFGWGHFEYWKVAGESIVNHG